MAYVRISATECVKNKDFDRKKWCANGVDCEKYSPYIYVNKIDGLQFTNFFNRQLRIIRAKTSFTCSICNETRPKGTRYFGERYDRVCHHCLKEYSDGTIKRLSEYIKKFEEMKEEINKNKEDWDNEAVANLI